MTQLWCPIFFKYFMVFIKRKQINSSDLTDGLEHWCTVLRYSTSMAWKPLSKANMTPMTPIIFTSGFLHQEANALNHAFLYSVLLSSIYSINLIQLLNWTNCATVKKCSESDECQLLSDTKEIVTIYGPPSNIKWHFICMVFIIYTAKPHYFNYFFS